MRILLATVALLSLASTGANTQSADMSLMAAPPAQRILGIWCPRPDGDRFHRCTRLNSGWIEISREAVETARGRCPILARSGWGNVMLRCRTDAGDVMTWRLTPELDGTLALVMGVSDRFSEPPVNEPWWSAVTVLTMAPDGAWGAATDVRISSATVEAIERCRLMAVKDTGCGAHQVTVHGGWALAFRCGPETILVADRDLAEAERRALMRERDMREHYVPSMPSCHRVVTVDPSGKALVTAPPVDQATAK